MKQGQLGHLPLSALQLPAGVSQPGCVLSALVLP